MNLKTLWAAAAISTALAAVTALPAQAQTLRWAAQNDILTMDPHSQNHATTNAILMHAYEGLTRYSATYQVEPALATKWTFISPTQVRFDLRKGVKFHDGTPFTADDVVFNAQYASEVNYGVQIGGRRIPGRAATFLRNGVYLPLSTVAEAFGAEYTPGVGGSFTQPAPRLTSVASESKPGERYDRVVLELNRPMPYTSSFKQGKLTLELPGVVGAAANYTTRGAYAKLVTVENVEAKKLLKVSLELPSGVGYRIYPVSSGLGGRSRIVLDVGASLSRSESVLAVRKRRPVIVLDPGHGGADVGVKGPRPEKTLTLEVAQQVGKLLTARGWQVLFTRTRDQKVSNTSRAALARRSDLFLSFHLSAFPGASRSGVSLYRFDGESGLALSDRLRLGGLAGDVRFMGAVSPLTRSQSFSSALSGSLVAGGFKVWQERAPRALILRDAPQVGLQLELGWPQNSQDALWLRDATKLKKFSSIVAASIATFLTPKDGS